MNSVYQDQNHRGALPSSPLAPYLTNASNQSWKEGIGNAVGNFVQSTEHRVSQWFWDGIGSLPKNYFSKDITNANYCDKSLWEGMFNARIEELQAQLLSELQEPQTDDVQELRGAGFPHVNKLREQMAAGLPHHAKPSLQEQLTALQGLVGKHTLSPQDYEAGLDALKEATSDHGHYTALIEQVRSTFRSNLKTEQEFLEECLQGDLLHLFKETPEKSLTPAPLNKVLRYYKPLMKHKTYAKQKEWIEQCYHTQSLLPLPPVKKHVTESSPVGVLSPHMKGKQDRPTWGRSIRNWGKFLWDNSGKLMTLGLATQVAAVQASGVNNTGKDFIPKGHSPDTLIPDLNQTFLTDKLPLSLNSLSVPVDRTLALDKDTEELNNDSAFSQEHSGIRQKRATPRGQHPLACVSEDVLRGITITDSIIALYTMQNQGSNNCIPYKDSKFCNDFIKSLIVVQCDVDHDVDHLDDAYEEAISGSLNNEAKVIKLSIALETLQKAFKKLYDEKQAFEKLYNENPSLWQSHQLKLKLDEPIENAQSVLGESIKNAQSLRKVLNEETNELKEHIRKLCIAEISSGKIEEAVKHFKELDYTDHDQLNAIIEQAYDYDKKKEPVIAELIKFVLDLPWFSHRAMGYEKLFNVMQAKEQLRSPQILILANKVQQTIDLGVTPSVRQEWESRLQDLKQKLTQAVDSILDAWASGIRNNGDTAQIKDFAREHSASFRGRLPDLIKKAYANNLGNAENIIQFVRNLHYIENGAVGYSSLYDQMSSNSHLNSYQLLMLAYKVKEFMEMPNYPKIDQGDKDKFETLKSNLETAVDSFLTPLANSIRSGNYDTVLVVIRRDCGGSFNDYWPQIIEKAYATQLSNTENILQLIRSFPCINQTARALMALFNQMKANGDLNSYQLLMVAYKLKQELDFVDNNPNFGYGSDGHQYYKDAYTKLKNSLPSSVRGLIWNGSRCTLRNTNWNEYLYASSDEFDHDRRYVFTWIPGGSNYPEAYWKITSDNNGKSFQLSNTYWENEYLYAPIHKLDHDRRYVFTWKPGGPVNNGEWEMTPYDNGNYFTLRNAYWNEYLYAAYYKPYDDERRRVLTWIPGGRKPAYSHWEIKCK